MSYPNPARGSVTLALTLKEPGRLRIGLFDLNGRRVRSVADEAQSAAGTHRFTFGGRESSALPAGIYFYRIEIPEGTYTGRIVIMNQ